VDASIGSGSVAVWSGCWIDVRSGTLVGKLPPPRGVAPVGWRQAEVGECGMALASCHVGAWGMIVLASCDEAMWVISHPFFRNRHTLLPDEGGGRDPRSDTIGGARSSLFLCPASGWPNRLAWYLAHGAGPHPPTGLLHDHARSRGFDTTHDQCSEHSAISGRTVSRIFLRRLRKILETVLPTAGMALLHWSSDAVRAGSSPESALSRGCPRIWKQEEGANRCLPPFRSPSW
jgi:hypothetical protein